MSVLKLTCPVCGANLKLEDGLDTYFCPYCGAKFELDADPNKKLHARIHLKDLQAASISEDKAYAQERYRLNYASKEKDHELVRFFKKIVICLIIFCVIPILCLGIAFHSHTEKHKDEIMIPNSYSSYIGENYHSVETDFKNLGFSNINVSPHADLIVGIHTKNESVESISINGNDSFSYHSYFPKNAKIRITYHTYWFNE